MTDQMDDRPLPPPTFSQHIMHLYQQALFALGRIENPITRKKEKSLNLAQYTIDTIALLDEKTQNNLAPDEKRYIQHILNELRMLFVEETKSLN